MSSTGHVGEGESYEAAARRELGEELGVRAPVKRVRKYRLPPITERGLTESEWVALFLCRTDARCKVDRSELESVAEYSEDEVRAMLSEGPLTPDAQIILDDYLRRSS
jgi:NADH pyrophosphatase NudC (nudix superfamily)